MISYFILNKSGNIIYQTVPTDKLESSEQNGIKYLPLLVIKDLIKNNLNTHIKHITTGDKVFAFWERHSLLYIACTKHERIPVSVLHKHLIVMDNFLRFNFGPQWQMRIEGNMYPRSRRHTLQPPLTIKKLTTCLEQLPYVTSYCSLRSPKCLCLIEQVDLQEDLSIRLIDTLQQCCNNVFIPSSSTITKPTIKISTLFSQPRKPTDKPIFYPHRHRNQHHNHNQQQAFIQKDIDRPFGVWEHAFLFAREKIVVHACNNKDQKLKQSSPENPIPTELLYFLKIMVADFIYEYCDTMEQEESSLIQHGASVPQAIESKNSNSNDNECETSPSTSSQTLCTSISTTGSLSQKSANFPFIYDSNSSFPFKISSKSSVTQLSSTTTAVPQVSWSSPAATTLIHSHLVTRLSKLDQGTTNRSHHHRHKSNTMDDHILNEMMPAMKVTSLTSPLEHYQHYHQQDDDLTDTSDNTTASAFTTTGLPPNAKLHHHQHHHHHHQSVSASSSPRLEKVSIPRHTFDYDHPIYLSSSVPNDDGLMMDPGKFISNDDIMERRRGASTNSSPIMRSRRESMIADYSTPLQQQQQQGKDDSDEGSQYTHTSQYQQQQQQQQQQSHYRRQQQSYNKNNNNPTAKVVQRWVKHGNKVTLSRICILKINESGLVAVILLSDDTLHLPLLFSSTNNNKDIVLHQQNQQMIKQISTSLKNALKDFSSFLLTKEVVHFTILSFAFSYPGLVHFVYIKDGILVSPQLVDLNELDKHHEILNIVFETYNIKPTNTMGTRIGKWRWPSVLRLKKLCDKMLNKGLSCQSSTPCIRCIEESSKKHQGFKLLYLKGDEEDEELIAIYFNFVPEDRIWFMHRRLLLDLGQRHFQK